MGSESQHFLRNLLVESDTSMNYNPQVYSGIIIRMNEEINMELVIVFKFHLPASSSGSFF